MSTHPSVIRTPWVLWELRSWDKDSCGEGSLSPEDGCGTGGCACWIVSVWLCTGTAYRVASTPMELWHWAGLVRLFRWGYATRAVPIWLSPWSYPHEALPVELSTWHYATTFVSIWLSPCDCPHGAVPLGLSSCGCPNGTMPPRMSPHGCPHVVVPMDLCHQGCLHAIFSMELSH